MNHIDLSGTLCTSISFPALLHEDKQFRHHFDIVIQEISIVCLYTCSLGLCKMQS